MSLKKTGHVSEFPTSRYHGITITLDFSMITDEMKRILQLLSVNLEKISNISKTHSFTYYTGEIQSIEQYLFGNCIKFLKKSDMVIFV